MKHNFTFASWQYHILQTCSLNKCTQLVRLQQQTKAQMKAEQHACRLVLAAKLVQTKSDRMSRDFP